MKVLNSDIDKVIEGFKGIAYLFPPVKQNTMLGMCETLNAMSCIDLPNCNDLRDLIRDIVVEYRDKLYKKLTAHDLTALDHKDNERLVARCFSIDEEDFDEAFYEMVEKYKL